MLIILITLGVLSALFCSGMIHCYILDRKVPYILVAALNFIAMLFVLTTLIIMGVK